MKYRNLLIVAIAFLGFQKGQAQTSFKPGLRGGFSFSTISETRSSYKTDFYVGAFGEINITKIYGLQPEITYSRQGSNNVGYYFNDNTQTELVKFRDLQLGYLSFTLLNKLTFGPGIQIQFGPAVDVLVNDNLDKVEMYNDLTLISGIAYRLPSGLTFEARLKKGILDVFDSSYYNDRNDYLFGSYNTNVNFQLGLSYAFGGKK
ncbi:outer membrane beta-barrel protein [Flavobacterium saccharophilum]|uniref:Outer membrane protein beta-barrel domain-containing protein n=1 Tax=Flavobacterium saccharophilum TaxID=29534 RepID=A0A1M7A5G2_9FLAO|nr:outer membrane beta-barrel protein [Flavobacterium saccharophilum]SHL37843.1 Outer membrane protein beta-barrel domain-containing protein [Flavobacterium saccharophilum]